MMAEYGYATTEEELLQEYSMLTPAQKKKLKKMRQTGGY